MQYELTGTLKVKKDEQKVNDSFRKREFVVEEHSTNYPQLILFELKQDKCRILDEYNIGDEVKVGFFINGREFTKDGITKYFTSLTASRLAKVGNIEKEEATYTTEADIPKDEESDKNLPF